MLFPEQVADIQQRLEQHKSEVIEYDTQLGVETNAHARKVLEGSRKYSKRQIETLQKQLEVHALAVQQDARNKRQEAEKAAQLEAERKRQEAIKAERKRQEELRARERREKEERERREAVERARLREEQQKRDAETRKKMAEEAARKRAEEEAEKERAARRFVLEADGRGQSQKYALRVNAGDEQFDILVEVRPVAQ